MPTTPASCRCLAKRGVKSSVPARRRDEIAEAIARGLGVPARSVPADKAAEALGPFFGGFTQLDNPTSNERTRELLGWNPSHAGLLADLAEGHYFQNAT